MMNDGYFDPSKIMLPFGGSKNMEPQMVSSMFKKQSASPTKKRSSMNLASLQHFINFRNNAQFELKYPEMARKQQQQTSLPASVSSSAAVKNTNASVFKNSLLR